MATPAASPSAAALLYLFADKVVEPDTALTKGFRVPCSEVAVKRTRLAAELFAIAFWSLREEGKIELSMGKRTLLGVGRPQVTAALRPAVRVRAPEQGASEPPFTLGDAIVFQLSQSSPAPVRRVIRDWFRVDEADPQGSVINRVAREISDLGLATGVQATGMLASSPELVIDCGRRAGFEGAAVEVLQRWHAFRSEEDGLGSRLTERAQTAIASRTYSESHD